MSDFNPIAEHFSKTRSSNWPFVKALVKQHVKSGDHVLDLACGNGRLFPLITERGASYAGLDLSEELITIAKKNHPDGQFDIGNMIRLPYETHACDKIFCIAAFHHVKTIEQRAQALSEMHRVLKPGGTLILTVWNLYQWRFTKYFWTSFVTSLKDRDHSVKDLSIPWKDSSGRVVNDRYYYAFRETELTDMMHEAGFLIDTSTIDTNLVIVATAG